MGGKKNNVQQSSFNVLPFDIDHNDSTKEWKWTKLPGLKRPRRYGVSAMIDEDRLIFCGGFDFDVSGSEYFFQYADMFNFDTLK